MRFTKMHGIGNDYVYVNGFAETVDDPAALAVRIADRHFGVGGDGLILILPPEPGTDAQVRMRMFNADGSEAEMCGNGVRCVAKYAIDHGLSDARPLRVQTGAGVKTIDYALDEAGKLQTATVDMGEPILETERIPARLKEVSQIINHSIRNLIDWASLGRHDWVKQSEIDLRMTCVSMGNPHVILFARDLEAIPLPQAGAELEGHNMFPQRTNVHFVQVNFPGDVTVVHWERGSGATLACGTGACAVCVAGVLTGRTERTITAHLPGGDLQLEWRQADNRVYMTGPAVEVFTGEWPE